VLEDVDLAVEPGEVVALVGPSGAGKSTLAALISGLVSPDTGLVEVEGRVAVVSQQPFLFHGSLRENLLLAAPDADDEHLWAALEAADLTGVVAGNEHGLDLQVGERGLQLSGGEAQRLTIARMLLTGAPIVVLDEPTSNVDIETEAKVRAAIERLTVDKTVIVIAHRRSTIAGVDRIVAMEDGRIVADTDPASDEGTALIQAMTVSS
jgi:ABC-type multidrug transport system fused ATPase/permease subunit